MIKRRFVFVAPDSHGMDLWRTHWPAQGLMMLGEEVVVLGAGSATQAVPLERRDIVILHATNQATRYITEEGELRGVEWMVRYCRRGAGSVIVNIDDDYTAHRDIQPLGDWFRLFLSDLVSGCRVANGVIVATEELVGVYAKWSRRVGVGRNYFPARLLAGRRYRKRDRQVVYAGRVGELGEHMPHRLDIREVAPYLSGLSIHAIGDPENVRSLIPEAKVTGAKWLPVEAFASKHRTLAQEESRAQVGIAPLVEHRWNRGKSWIKPLEYALAGVPGIVPAWHPGYAALELPLARYSEPAEIREEIDRLLGLSEAELSRIGADSLAGARRYTHEEQGAEEWRRALLALA